MSKKRSLWWFQAQISVSADSRKWIFWVSWGYLMIYLSLIFHQTSPSLKRTCRLCLQKNQELLFSSSFCDVGSLLPQTSLHTSRGTSETSASATSEGSCSTGDSAHCQQQYWHTNPRGGIKRCAGKRIPLFNPPPLPSLSILISLKFSLKLNKCVLAVRPKDNISVLILATVLKEEETFYAALKVTNSLWMLQCLPFEK